MNESEQIIVDVFRDSVQIFCRRPVYWKDPHGFQVWARARSLFAIERGVRLTAADTTPAGRKQFSRLRLALEEAGLIQLTYFGPTSVYASLTTAGLKLAEKLTGEKAPADLKKATRTLAESPQ